MPARKAWGNGGKYERNFIYDVYYDDIYKHQIIKKYNLNNNEYDKYIDSKFMKYKNIHAATQITGIRLKELRELAGLTPTSLGKKINKHHNVILSIENGKTDSSK